MKSMQPNDDMPRQRLLPPKIFGGALIIALILKLIIPMRFLGAGTGREMGSLLGWLIVLASLALAAWAALALEMADTPISPDEPARNLVTGGPYRFARNPIYLSAALIFLGVGFIADSLWLFLAIPVVMFAVKKFAITPEEAQLTEKFGDAYREYSAAVRRWF